MSLIIFLLVVGGIFILILIVGAGLSLFSAIFGYYNDPYERDLARMDYEDEVLDRLDRIADRRHGDTYVNIDARQIHFHDYGDDD
ncbi:MAG: hypothetical protein FWB83_10745 [Treponema sp.]|nr:hypothetical protein [Treponema sp.]